MLPEQKELSLNGFKCWMRRSNIQRSNNRYATLSIYNWHSNRYFINIVLGHIISNKGLVSGTILKILNKAKEKKIEKKEIKE